MAFKQDEDFLRFITMGAAGSAHAARYLTVEHDHRMVELERYAMANKLWTTKIKRLRVPDLVCLDCGLRVEARAKSKLEIKLSDSETAGREWHQGLRNEDVVAFVPWDGDRQTPRSNVECFTVGALHESVEHSKLGPRKSASEGAERDRTWPARVPRYGGEVLEVDDDGQRVKLHLDTDRRQTYRIDLDTPAYGYVEAGERAEADEQFLLGVVPPPSADELSCPGRTRDEREELTSQDAVTRYIAVKVTGLQEDAGVVETLRAVAYEDEDPRIRLEAWGSLARIDPETYTAAVASTAENRDPDDPSAMAMAMEAVFILSEVGTPAARDALDRLAADRSLDSEARCAAVWGLGVAGVGEADRVVRYIADEDEAVALHALAGIGSLSEQVASRVGEILAEAATDAEAAAAAALLAAQERLGADILLELAGRKGHVGVWALAGLGQLDEVVVRSVSSGRLTPELERVLEPAWALNRSWLRKQEVDTPLRFLQRQTIRHQP